MRNRRSLAAARLLGLVAIAAVPLFVVVGWWGLAVPVVLSVTAAAFAPRPRRVPGMGPARQFLASAVRRLRPHAWRPGVRL